MHRIAGEELLVMLPHRAHLDGGARGSRWCWAPPFPHPSPLHRRCYLQRSLRFRGLDYCPQVQLQRRRPGCLQSPRWPGYWPQYSHPHHRRCFGARSNGTEGSGGIYWYESTSLISSEDSPSNQSLQDVFRTRLVGAVPHPLMSARPVALLLYPIIVAGRSLTSASGSHRSATACTSTRAAHVAHARMMIDVYSLRAEHVVRKGAAAACSVSCTATTTTTATATTRRRSSTTTSWRRRLRAGPGAVDDIAQLASRPACALTVPAIIAARAPLKTPPARIAAIVAAIVAVTIWGRGLARGRYYTSRHCYELPRRVSQSPISERGGMAEDSCDDMKPSRLVASCAQGLTVRFEFELKQQVSKRYVLVIALKSQQCRR